MIISNFNDKNVSDDNNLDYLNDQTFRNITRLFALSFTNGDDDPTTQLTHKAPISCPYRPILVETSRTTIGPK